MKTIDDIVYGELLQKLEKRKLKLERINDNLKLWLQLVEENPGKVALTCVGVAVAIARSPEAALWTAKVLVKAVKGAPMIAAAAAPLCWASGKE